MATHIAYARYGDNPGVLETYDVADTTQHVKALYAEYGTPSTSVDVSGDRLMVRLAWVLVTPNGDHHEDVVWL